MNICKALNSLVGARGFEPPTTCTPCRYATRLRYAPKEEKYIRHSEVLEPADSSSNQKPVSFTLRWSKWRSFRHRARCRKRPCDLSRPRGRPRIRRSQYRNSDCVYSDV